MKVPMHEAADIFPLMEGADFDELVEDIKTNGQLEPIYTYEGKILDGRNRYRACARLCIKPWLEELDTDEYADPVATVLSLNLKRRHLTPAQRAMAASKADKLWEAERKAAEKRAKAGRTRTDPQENVPGGQTRDRVGKAFNVSGKSVETGKKIREKAAPELIEAVERGEVSLYAAHRMVEEIPKEEQAEGLDGPDKALETEDEYRKACKWAFNLCSRANITINRLSRNHELSVRQRKELKRAAKAVRETFERWDSELGPTSSKRKRTKTTSRTG